MILLNSKPRFLAAITKATSPGDSSDKSGSITYKVLKTGRVRLGSKLLETKVKKLMEAAIVDANRTMGYINLRNATNYLDKLEGYTSSLEISAITP